MTMFGSVVRPSGLIKRTTLIISKEEMKHIMKIVKSLEESGSLINSISEPIQNEAKGQKGGLLSILLGTLDAILFYINRLQQVKEQLEKFRIFNANSFLNKF